MIRKSVQRFSDKIMRKQQEPAGHCFRNNSKGDVGAAKRASSF